MQFLSLLILSAALVYSASAPGASDSLFGDWSGIRSSAVAAGITPSVVYTYDYAKPVQGGNDNAQVVMGNLDVLADVDLASSLSLPGARLFVYLLGNHSHASGEGDFLADKLGNAQVVSNIEAPTAARLYEFWYDQRFLAAWSIRAGLYDLNSEFDVIESAGGLINSSFGIGSDFAQTGANGPSIFPVTSLALRMKYESAGGVYAQIALLDGVPGDLEHERGTHVKLGGGDGVLQVIEAGFITAAKPSQRFGKMALGAWQYNPDQIALTDDPTAPARELDDNRGLYVLAEHQIFQEQADPVQGVRVFARYGVARSTINAIHRYAGTGLSWLGVFSGRDEDQLLAGVAVAQFGAEFRALQGQAGNALAREERIYEISYRTQVMPWLVLQPDLQFIEDPAFNATSDRATVLLLRTEIVF